MSQSVTMDPIGVVHTPFAEKLTAPRQPAALPGVTGRIELFPGHNYEHALEDLDGWERIWVIFWFHLNQGWRPKVLPPRSSGQRRGTFSTRSPHRPNPIGLSVVRLDSIDGLTLHVRDVDMVDGTPVLDLKPYVPYADAHPSARPGWLSPAPQEVGDPVAGFEIAWSPLGAAQASWIHQAGGVDLVALVTPVLRLGPQPHPYRRIKRDAEGLRLAVKDWRVRFRVEQRTVVIDEVRSGYRPSELARLAAVPELALHVAYVAEFGQGSG
jgi:tRNA-Thr(GGU) m(6)t(6)A37 methyltransferase TsaA